MQVSFPAVLKLKLVPRLVELKKKSQKMNEQMNVHIYRHNRLKSAVLFWSAARTTSSDRCHCCHR